MLYNKEKMSNQIHSDRLERIIHNIDLIGEHPENVKWIMREGIWTPERRYEEFPDLICVMKSTLFYTHGFSIPIEYKYHIDKKDKAMRQLINGGRFIREELKLVVEYGIFVCGEGFHHERIKL
jgi:hypothetical protein